MNISTIPLFAELSPHDQNTIGLFCQERTLTASETLFEEGDEATALYVLLSGAVEVTRNRTHGTTLVATIEAPMSVVGEMAFFAEWHKSLRRNATVRAVPYYESTKLLVILGTEFLRLGLEYPELLEKIVHIIRTRSEVSAEPRYEDVR